MQQTVNKEIAKSRIYSLDILRGVVIILCVFLTAIPKGDYEYHFAHHADWYGITLIDFILPAFITMIGTSMAIGYKKGVNWLKLSKRTFLFILYGLIFTMIISWNLDFATLRFTGVLQLFAIIGVLTAIITRITQSPLKIMIIALFITSLYGGFVISFSEGCSESLPQPTCNPSQPIDSFIFGENHLYHQGKPGYDPEGLLVSLSALSNSLIGFAMGRILLNRKTGTVWKQLFIYGSIIVIFAFIWKEFLPFNKKIWTPSFSLLTAGATCLSLSFLYLIYDHFQISKQTSLLNPINFFLEGFGRNSFFNLFREFYP
ncbi:heparan-alpha-glucosaminide N-acetyltransferase domain-containing protein [Bacillus carboniphilus]|uniref:Heparan-alpha-glucosaminide N-acetyltransferase domain-containing protein n=1 Tax=Bacillus carboniphilus TaxID=86663 RepID=A0ABY9JTW2_9BACI|nr:heparan-alpha-glucosaminide N-acetyltransferase domain-containing protein [Bacillus carboniphilus]WLR42829.1 heparan-alpha-glucosaminide N-acetyltransferase domain-containing protein [Bacillus carboniphilus]